MDSAHTYGTLIPCGGGDPIPLLKRKLLIGRRSSCDIILDFPNVSSRHCELELINGYWHIVDLNSSNGIKVNDVRCDQKWVLPGDILAVARHRYEVSYEATGDRPAPEEENPFARSLLEKAGLAKAESRPRSKPPARTDAEEDIALKWLMGDD
jgi:adenylate cyclase